MYLFRTPFAESLLQSFISANRGYRICWGCTSCVIGEIDRIYGVVHSVDYIEHICKGSDTVERSDCKDTYWILVVDDDASNLKIANHILSGEGMKVSLAKSGKEAIEFLEENHPDLILLDIHMPEMDGFEVMSVIQKNPNSEKIPVIFLTADDDCQVETKGLSLGAVDFVKKPFVPKVLLLRVRHSVELFRLQADLTGEVERKTQEIVLQNEKLERITMQIVKTLSGVIEAKDKYTNGHSTRVAEYSMEIAKRAGCTRDMQKDVYFMGLLHDIGKVGIPDAIVCKPDRLDDDEYAIIKEHPVVGSSILKNITDFPRLVIGARWHHERYDGTGYPDGIKGEKIPVEARIIAVADAYDAMTSKRSYRDGLPQGKVTEELKRARGTQLDPVFTDIMLAMIEEDTEYRLREK